MSDDPDLSSPGARLKHARKKAGYKHATLAAPACGISAPRIRAHEANKRGIKPDVAETYARAFCCTAAWLLYGDGPGVSDGAPITGRVVAGGWIAPATGGLGDGDVETPRPPGVPPDAEALVVAGDAMQPAYADGDTLFVGAASEDLDDIAARLVGHDCVVRLMDGSDLVRRLDPGKTPGRFTLTGINAPPLRDVQIWRAAPILWVRKAGVS